MTIWIRQDDILRIGIDEYDILQIGIDEYEILRIGIDEYEITNCEDEDDYDWCMDCAIYDLKDAMKYTYGDFD